LIRIFEDHNRRGPPPKLAPVAFRTGFNRLPPRMFSHVGQVPADRCGEVGAILAPKLAPDYVDQRGVRRCSSIREQKEINRPRVPDGITWIALDVCRKVFKTGALNRSATHPTYLFSLVFSEALPSNVLCCRNASAQAAKPYFSIVKDLVDLDRSILLHRRREMRIKIECHTDR
jgi:hypothetical protein